MSERVRGKIWYSKREKDLIIEWQNRKLKAIGRLVSEVFEGRLSSEEEKTLRVSISYVPDSQERS